MNSIDRLYYSMPQLPSLNFSLLHLCIKSTFRIPRATLTLGATAPKNCPMAVSAEEDSFRDTSSAEDSVSSVVVLSDFQL